MADNGSVLHVTSNFEANSIRIYVNGNYRSTVCGVWFDDDHCLTFECDANDIPCLKLFMAIADNMEYMLSINNDGITTRFILELYLEDTDRLKYAVNHFHFNYVQSSVWIHWLKRFIMNFEDNDDMIWNHENSSKRSLPKLVPVRLPWHRLQGDQLIYITHLHHVRIYAGAYIEDEYLYIWFGHKREDYLNLIHGVIMEYATEFYRAIRETGLTLRKHRLAEPWMGSAFKIDRPELMNFVINYIESHPLIGLRVSRRINENMI